EGEPARERWRVLSQLVTVADVFRTRLALAAAVDDIGENRGLEIRCRRQQLELTGIAANRVGLFPALTDAAAIERAGPYLRDAPALALAHPALTDAVEQHVGACGVDVVEAAIGAEEVGRENVAGLVGQ